MSHAEHSGITLAQGAAQAGSVVVWVIALIVAALVGGLVILAVRKKMLEPDRAEVASEGLFDSLRRMRDSGEITGAEYENARRRLIESATQKKPAGPRLSKDQSDILAAAAAAEPLPVRPKPPRLEAPPGYDLAGDPLPRATGRTGSGGEQGQNP